MNWKAGDIAICINASMIKHQSPPLRVNAEYVVQSSKKCSCGLVALDIGISSELNMITYCRCGIGTINDSVRWCDASRFIKKKTKEEQLAEAIAVEDFETAHKLTNSEEVK